MSQPKYKTLYADVLIELEHLQEENRGLSRRQKELNSILACEGAGLAEHLATLTQLYKIKEFNLSPLGNQCLLVYFGAISRITYKAKKTGFQLTTIRGIPVNIDQTKSIVEDFRNKD